MMFIIRRMEVLKSTCRQWSQWSGLVQKPCPQAAWSLQQPSAFWNFFNQTIFMMRQLLRQLSKVLKLWCWYHLMVLDNYWIPFALRNEAVLIETILPCIVLQKVKRAQISWKFSNPKWLDGINTLEFSLKHPLQSTFNRPLISR